MLVLVGLVTVAFIVVTASTFGAFWGAMLPIAAFTWGVV
jgi:hypothetical protein